MRYIVSIRSVLLLVQDLDMIQGKVTLIQWNCQGSPALSAKQGKQRLQTNPFSKE